MNPVGQNDHGHVGEREPKDLLPRSVRLLLGATGPGVSDRRLREAVAGKVVLVTGASSGIGKASGLATIARATIPAASSVLIPGT
jgi:hypothetical protein